MSLDPSFPTCATSAEKPAGQKTFVIALRAGRLANRLILFANFAAMAEEKGHRVVNVTFHSYAHWFDATRRDIYCQYPAPARRSWMDIVPGMAGAIRATRFFYRIARAACVMNEQVRFFGGKVMRLRETRTPGVTFLEDPAIEAQVAGAQVVFVYDWAFRAPQWVRRHAAKIRSHFRPLESIERECRADMDALRQGAGLVVGMHIRQGDYREWRGGRYYYPVSRYAEWMREMAGHFPDRRVAFYVCSDEPRVAAEFPGLTVQFGGASAVRDLYTLARCDFLLGAPSTFSQWASFYGNVPLLHLYESSAKINPAAFAVSDLGEIPGVSAGSKPAIFS
jgi:hypothetical protein